MRHRLAVGAIAAAVAWPLGTARAELPPLIPRRILFGNPDKKAPQISPDGKRLAYLAPDQNVLNVWVRTVGKEDDRAVTRDRKRGVCCYLWAQNNEHLLYRQDKDGDENWHIYSVALSTDRIRDLTPYQGVQAKVLAMEPDLPHDILIAINKRNPQFHDVYRVDLRTGALTQEALNDRQFVGWIADHDLHVRAAMTVSPGGGTTLEVREAGGSVWRTLTSWDPQDALTSGPIGFTPDAKGLYVLSSSGSNTQELREIDLATGKETVIAYDDEADVARLFIHPTEHRVQAIAYARQRMEWEVLDDSIADDFKKIKGLRRGDFGINNRDHGDRVWLLYFYADNGPIYYYAYDRTARKAEFLFTCLEAMEGLTLAEMKPITFRARDGLAIHGYLTTPPGIRARNLPMVVLVHGGPWRRDTWGYDGVAQWLANRGYAVLQVNFRGSTGYGKEFLNAGDREWAGKMHYDLLDGVNWAINNGIADRKRVAIFGSSYGGYAALVGLTFTPEVFCCGVDISGASNLVTYLQNLPVYLKAVEPVFWDRVGHPIKDAEFLKSRSPLFRIDRITKPLLIAQGVNDPWVKRSESLKIVEALRKTGKDVTYEEYEDEGHHFVRPETRLDFYAKAERFLAKHLGGRYEE